MKKIYLGLLIRLLTFSTKAQNSLNFDGDNDKLDCGNQSSVQISGLQITLEAWIYPTAWKANIWSGNIINKENKNPDNGYMLSCGDGGKLNFNLGNNGSNEITTASGSLSLNTWQHVAATYDGSKMRLYINGIPIDSSSLSFTVSSATQNLTIGNWSNSSERRFYGNIEEVRIWSSARTEAEINSNLNSELCYTHTDLKAYYRLNEGVAFDNNLEIDSASDLSGNNNHRTLSNFSLNDLSSNWVDGIEFASTSIVIDSRIECDSLVWIDGNTYYADNDSAIFYITDGSLCDNMVTFNLTINTLNDSVTQDSTSLTANLDSASYQWINCLEMTPLLDDTSQTLQLPQTEIMRWSSLTMAAQTLQYVIQLMI